MRISTATFKYRLSIRSTILSISILFSVFILPLAAFAWGPARQTFTTQNPATYVTFNSITDNKSFGDERNFFRIRDVASGEKYQDAEVLQAGKEYEAVVFFHNNASSSLNAGGTGVAHGAYAKVQLPAIVKAGDQNGNAEAFVGASNANPTQVYDYITLKNPTTVDMAIRLESGTVKYQSYGPHDGDILSDTALFGGSGQPLGFDSLDGTLPGCDHYSGYITFKFKALQPGFTFAKDVRPSGTKTWENQVTVPKGTTVEYRLSYVNTGDTVQNNVTLKDLLPAGLSYVKGSTKLYTTATPEGKTLTDEISQGGMDVGSYNPDAGSFLTFSAHVDGDPCSKLTNIAYAVTNNGTKKDSATVTVAGTCATTLPTTGPVEIVAGLVGVAAMTLGIVYYFRSRRDLENALLDAHMHKTTAPSLLDTDSDLKNQDK